MSEKLPHCTVPWGPSPPASGNGQMREKVAGDKWERNLLPYSRLPEVGLCPTKMNERVYTLLMIFIVLNNK